MNDNEAGLFLGCMNGMDLFAAATEEQAKEIKQDYFGTDNDLILLEIFEKTMKTLRPNEQNIIWNTILSKLELHDLNLTMSEVLDMVRAKLIHDTIPILHWSPQPLPRVVHDPRGDYTIREA